MKIGAYTVKNKFYYEDEPLNEDIKKELGRTAADLLYGIGTGLGTGISKVASKTVIPAAKALTPGWGTYTGGIGTAIKNSAEVANAVRKGRGVVDAAGKKVLDANGVQLLQKISKPQAAKELAHNLLLKDRTGLGKAKLGVGAVGAYGVYNDIKNNEGKQTKRITGALKSTVGTGVNIVRNSGESIMAAANIGAVTVASLASALAGIQSSFNMLYAKSDCYANPDSEVCKKLVREKNEAERKAKEKAAADKAAREPRTPMQQKIDSLKELPSKASEKLSTYSTGQKAAVGIGAAALGLTAAAIAAKAIKDSFEKKDWYNKKCSRIQNPDQKEKCQAYVYKRTMKELQSKLSRCKLANNPQKCVDMITAKIQEINKKTD
jgi:hypothetical protein